MEEALENSELNERQKAFCREYIFDWNGRRAAIAAGYSEKTAAEMAYENLNKPHIKAYIELIQADLEKIAGMSRLRVLREHEKLAFSNIAHLHDTWVTRKAFEELSEDQKACIMEIQTQTRTIDTEEGGSIQVDFVKIKLYDKHKSLESIAKLLGYNEPEKIDHTSKGKPFTLNIKADPE